MIPLFKTLKFSGLAVVLSMTGFGCATSALKSSDVQRDPNSALVAIALSVHNGEAEEIHVVDSDNNEKSFSLVRPTVKVANEDVYLFELDPKKTYTIKSLHNGSYRTTMDKRTKQQFAVEPGTITYLCSYMLYQRNAHFAEAVPAQASAHTGVGEALAELYPTRKFRYGYTPERYLLPFAAAPR